jgi:asparagine synthase (glutamine-hydrolysing)
MCGICGAVSAQPGPTGSREVLQRMTASMHHRGPDDEGYFVDDHAQLGMRRLAIIDLDTGHQPLTNEDRSLWLVCNGEIYNYRELRRELESKGHQFSSNSDSEVILHAYEEHQERCVELFSGMFAFALWDTNQRTLFLARDRIGIKPLYYWHDGQQIVFGSELKALLHHPGVPTQIDPAALDLFLSVEYVPGPMTIYAGVRKLQPGHYLTFRSGTTRVENYWEIPCRTVPQEEARCVEELTGLLRDSVRQHMVSDVPLGVFLSGGLDSSTIVALMRQASGEKIRTFSIGFEDSSYNELPYARAVASHFQTDHTEEIISPNIGDLFELLVGSMDEPFGDFSIFPTYLVSKLASSSVKVVLSGDGGDEVFGGYDTYLAQGMYRYLDHLPANFRRKALPYLFDLIPPRQEKKGMINKAKRFFEGGKHPESLQHMRWMIFLDEAAKDSLYHPDLRSSLNGHPGLSVFSEMVSQASGRDHLAQQQSLDIKTYLADDILTKVDRMSMAASVEARVPLLDHRVVEYAVNLPAGMKIRRGQTKVILRKVMRPHLPKMVIEKPKEGFSIPIKHWLRGPLQPLMRDLLSPDRLRRQAFFNPTTVSLWMKEHLEGRKNHSHRLWALMVFEYWLENAHNQVFQSQPGTRLHG